MLYAAVCDEYIFFIFTRRTSATHLDLDEDDDTYTTEFL